MQFRNRKSFCVCVLLSNSAEFYTYHRIDTPKIMLYSRFLEIIGWAILLTIIMSVNYSFLVFAYSAWFDCCFCVDVAFYAAIKTLPSRIRLNQMSNNDFGRISYWPTNLTYYMSLLALFPSRHFIVFCWTFEFWFAKSKYHLNFEQL